jgi:predicted alpha/beta-fold hydrolase
MRPFDPLFQNPHLQTILSHYWPRNGEERRFPLESRRYRTEPGVEVLVESQRPEGRARGEIVMVHGLEGSGAAVYVRSLSGAALHRGFAAHRFNLRTCGGTERWCKTLYHAGLTSDVLAVLRELRQQGRAPAAIIGFSLGGNVVLKLAGELGEGAPELIRSVCAVSTPLDLAACARRIHEPDNWIYERRFVKRMKQRLRATGRHPAADFESLRSVFDLDDRITAPSFGFGNAPNYYATQSASQYLGRIRVPALLVQAKDDPFIPFSVYEDGLVRQNPRIQLIVTEHGGHLGFMSRRHPRFWLDEVLIDWIMSFGV